MEVELSKKQLESFKCLPNVILVKPDFNHVSEYKKGNIKIKLATSYELEKFAVTTGEVISNCPKLHFDKHGGTNISTRYDSTVETLVGDRVYFHYTEMDRCEKHGKVIKCDGEIYFAMRYESLFCLKRECQM